MSGGVLGEEGGRLRARGVCCSVTREGFLESLRVLGADIAGRLLRLSALLQNGRLS